MKRIYNFSAGPATLPEAVLLTIQSQLYNTNNTGMSVMEMSHRSSSFEAILSKTKQSLKTVLQIPDNYSILFLQGGASLQFSMIPMNFNKNKTIDLIHTGVWSQKAMEEASIFTKVNVIASGEDQGFLSLPLMDDIKANPLADYCYYVSNNTIYCTQFKEIPIQHPTLICDMSSDICSKPIDVSKYALIFAGAQKNLGIAGVTVVIIRNDLLDQIASPLPAMLDYRVHVKNDSLYNTPSTFGIYVTGLICEWIIQQGGLKSIEQLNQQKAELLYQAIDESSLFVNKVKKSDRSLMNVSFTSDNDEVDKAFIKFAQTYGCDGLKGHRLAKGCRASLYNAMTLEGVATLVNAIKDFERKQLEV